MEERTEFKKTPKPESFEKQNYYEIEVFAKFTLGQIWRFFDSIDFWRSRDIRLIILKTAMENDKVM